MNFLKISLTLVIMGMFLFGCKEKHEIEIVPDLDAIYLPISQVSIPPKEMNGLDTLYKKNISNIIRYNAISDPKYPIEYNIDIRLYINEDGKIQMIKNQGSEIRYINSSDEINYDVINKILVAISKSMQNWEFSPAFINNKPVKSRTDFIVTMIDSSYGRYHVNVGDLFTVMPNMNDFVPVDKLPQVITPAVPKYPDQAKSSGIEGTAYVKLLVNTDGIPAKAVVIKTDNEIFNQPSIDAAMQFKFTPALKENKPVAVWVVIPFKYKLSDSEGRLMRKDELKKIDPKKINNKN